MTYETQATLVDLVRTDTSQRSSKYGEPVIRRAIYRAFNNAFEETYWREHTTWFQGTLSGTDGTLTEDLSFIRRYGDIGSTFHENSPWLIQELPQTFNPMQLNSGASPLYRTPWNAHYQQSPPNQQPLPTPDTKKIQFFPNNATGAIGFFVRVHPGNFTDQDTYVVPFDADALFYWACAHMNARSEDNSFNWYMGQYQDRISDLKTTEARFPMPHNTRDAAAHIPDRWYTCSA